MIRAIKITDDEIRKLILSSSQAHSIIQGNEDLFIEVLRSAVTKEDVVAVAYRKRQLEAFNRLLKDEDYFERAKQKELF